MTDLLSSRDVGRLLDESPDWVNQQALRLERRGVTGLRTRVTGRLTKWHYTAKAVTVLMVARAGREGR